MNEFITAKDVEELFHFAGRTARQLLQNGYGKDL